MTASLSDWKTNGKEDFHISCRLGTHLSHLVSVHLLKDAVSLKLQQGFIWRIQELLTSLIQSTLVKKCNWRLRDSAFPVISDEAFMFLQMCLCLPWALISLVPVEEPQITSSLGHFSPENVLLYSIWLKYLAVVLLKDLPQGSYTSYCLLKTYIYTHVK